jgi:hypothetical protein
MKSLFRLREDASIDAFNKLSKIVNTRPVDEAHVALRPPTNIQAKWLIYNFVFYLSLDPEKITAKIEK